MSEHTEAETSGQEPIPHQDRPKPPNCTCDYPRRVYRSGSGHMPGCPAHQEWWDSFNQEHFGPAADREG